MNTADLKRIKRAQRHMEKHPRSTALLDTLRSIPYESHVEPIVAVVHNCGSAGDAQRDARVFRCFSCGVRPSSEFKVT